MKSLSQHINEKLIDEKLIINKNLKAHIYKYAPKNKVELYEILMKKLKDNDHSNNSSDVLDCTDINVTSLNDLSYTFSCSSARVRNEFIEYMKGIKVIDLTGWDVSNVTNFEEMFSYCYAEKIIGLDDWDVSNGENFYGMFEKCKHLVDMSFVNNWSVENATTVHSMFKECSSMTNIDISNWNVKSLVTAQGMFMDCNNLKSIGDISDWNISSNDFVNGKEMFRGCLKLQFTGDLNNWKRKKKLPYYFSSYNMFRDMPKTYRRPDWYDYSS